MQEADYRWFIDNYQKLFLEHGVAFLAIKNKTVIGVYSSYSEGVKETLKSEPIGSFIVQLCNGAEVAYTNYISSMNFV